MYRPQDYQLQITVKAIVVGDAGVGKTCILKRLADSEFHENEKPTIGVDFMIRTFDATKSGRAFKLQCWDTAGQERFRSLVRSYFNGAYVLLFVFDLCRKETLLSIEEFWREYACWSRGVRGFFESAHTPGAVAYLVGNKCDRVSLREVTTDEGATYALQHGMKYLEMSALTGESVASEFQSIIDDLDAHDRRQEEDHPGKPLFTARETVSLLASEGGGEEAELMDGLEQIQKNISQKKRNCC